MKTERKIVMLGTRADACGGIASVVKVYAEDGLFERRNVVYLPTHCSGDAREKIGLYVSAMSRLVGLVLTGQVQLVHVHGAINASFWRKYSFLLVLFALRVPVILHVHAGRFPEFYEEQCGRAGRCLVRHALRRADRIIAVSAELQQWIVALTGRCNVTTIGNPAVACPIPHPRTRAASLLLFMGHIEQSKGAFDLIRAMPAIVAAFPAARLRLCGDGDLMQARSLVRSLALGEHVDVLGWVDQRCREQLLRQATVFVLPSYFEGLPMSLLEAMSHALPVVATTVGGIPEAVTDGVEGLLVEPGDIGAISAAIKRILRHPGEGVRMGAAGRARTQVQFSTKRMISALEAVYDQVGIGRRPAGRAIGGRRTRHDRAHPGVQARNEKLGAEVGNEDLV